MYLDNEEEASSTNICECFSSYIEQVDYSKPSKLKEYKESTLKNLPIKFSFSD